MDEQFHFQSLFRGQTVAVTDVCCRPGGGECGPEEYSETTTIVFPRAGAFVRHFGRHEVVANSNHVLFFRSGETYRVSHPVSGGDDCTSLAFDPEILTDAVALFDPAARDRRESPVGITHGPSRPELGLFLHRLRQWLRVDSVESHAVEELAIALLDAVLDGAYRARGERPAATGRAAVRLQRERVEAAKSYVTGQFRSRLTLAGIARAVHYSPYHLARLFRREAGEPIHRYLNRLRLGKAALETAGRRCRRPDRTGPRPRVLQPQPFQLHLSPPIRHIPFRIAAHADARAPAGDEQEPESGGARDAGRMTTRSEDRGVRGARVVSGLPAGGRLPMAVSKCPVCDWEIKDKGQEVKVGVKKVLVCCEDCAKQVPQRQLRRTSSPQRMKSPGG